MPLPPPPEPRLEDMESVQELFEDEDYLEQELEALSNPSSLPIIQSPPLSPTHHDQVYLSGGSPMGQPYDYHPPSSRSLSPPGKTYHSALSSPPRSLSPPDEIGRASCRERVSSPV